MKWLYLKQLLSISAVLLIFLVCIGGRAAAADNEPKASPRIPPPPIDCTKNQGKESEGFTIKAELLTNPLPQGEKVLLRLTLTNVSDTEKTIWLRGYADADFALLIQDPSGNQHKIANEEQFVTVTWASAVFQLKPGESCNEDYDVGRVYDFPIEGEYQITAGCRVPGEFRVLSAENAPVVNNKVPADVVSNTVVLTIAPPFIDFTKGQGEESEGFTLKAALDQTVVTLGKSTRLSLTLTNIETTQRIVDMRDPIVDALYIQSPDGKQHRLVAERGNNTSAWNAHYLFEPGGKYTKTYETELVCHNGSYHMPTYIGFDFSAIGDYKITVGRKVPKLDGEGFADVISNTVVLTVTAPDSPEK